MENAHGEIRCYRAEHTKTTLSPLTKSWGIRRVWTLAGLGIEGLGAGLESIVGIGDGFNRVFSIIVAEDGGTRGNTAKRSQ
jgi:hypothetical protein